MSDPRRIKEEQGFDGALLRSADSDKPSEKSRRALALALALAPVPLIGSAGSAGAAGVTTTPAVAAKVGLSATAKVLTAISFTAGIGTGAVVMVAHSQPSPSPITAPRTAAVSERPTPDPIRLDDSIAAPAVVNTEPPAVVSTPAPVAHAPKPRTVGRPPAPSIAPVEAPPSAESAPTTDAPAGSAVEPVTTNETRLADELALLDRALAALRRKDLATALDALDAYDRAFPAGALVPEAAVARIQAMIAAGDRARASALAAAFIAAHPESPLARRVRTLIDNIPP